MNNFGQALKAARVGLGWTLREFCLKNKLDPGNMSKIERGLLPPPRSARVIQGWLRLMGYEEDDRTVGAILNQALLELKERVTGEFCDLRSDPNTENLPMKPKVMWAIVNRNTNELGSHPVNYVNYPSLYERKEWASAEVGTLGKVVKVEIVELRDSIKT